MSNNISKPITVIYDEFKINLRKLINESGLPAFIIEPVLRDTYNTIKLAEKNQLENDYRQYQETISKQKALSDSEDANGN